MKIRLSIIFIFAAVFAFAAPKVYAQIVVNGPDGTPISGNVGACMMGMESITGNVQDPIWIYPDGKMYPITGTYNVNVDCGDQAGTAACTNLQNAVAQISTGQTGFPQQTTAPSNNSITYKIGSFSADCGQADGQDVNVCEKSTVLFNDNGTVSGIAATVYFNENGGQYNMDDNLSNNPNLIVSLARHETGHAFGLSDAYAFGTNYQGMMGEFLSTAINNPSAPALSWDPITVSLIQSIGETVAAGGSITLNELNCLGQSCNESQIPLFQIQANGYDSLECTSDAGYAASCISYNGGACTYSDSSCTCPTNGLPGYCLDSRGNQFPAPEGFCSSSGSSSGTSAALGSGTTDGCTCTPNGAMCFDANGNSIPAPADWCSAGIIPSGEICACANGTPDCSASNGSSVEAPTDFSCEVSGLTSGSGETTYGYTCNDDGTCSYVAGGEYPDETSCDEACGSE